MDRSRMRSINKLTLMFFFPAFILIQLLFANNVFAQTPKVYVVNSQDASVSVIDTSSDKVIKTIPIEGNPAGIVVSLSDRNVYVSSQDKTTISLIDTKSDAVVYDIDVGAGSTAMAIMPDGSEILVAVPSKDTIALIDTASNKAVGKIALSGVNAITFDSQGVYAFADSEVMKHHALQEFTTATNAMLYPIPVSDSAKALSFSPDSKLIYYILNGKDSIEVYDIYNKNIVSEIPVNSPNDIIFTHNGKTGLTVSQDDNTLVLFDAKTNTIITKIKVGKKPFAITVNQNDTKAYVTNEESDDVSVVDLNSKKVIDTISVGKAPQKIAIQHIGLS